MVLTACESRVLTVIISESVPVFLPHVFPQLLLVPTLGTQICFWPWVKLSEKRRCKKEYQLCWGRGLILSVRLYADVTLNIFRRILSLQENWPLLGFKEFNRWALALL